MKEVEAIYLKPVRLLRDVLAESFAGEPIVLPKGTVGTVVDVYVHVEICNDDGSTRSLVMLHSDTVEKV